MKIFIWIIYIYLIGAYASTRSRSNGFRSYPTTVKTHENDTVLLPCYVEDQGLQTRVRWWREEDLLADNLEPVLLPNERVTMYSNGSLRVLHVQREDSGEYVCQAIRPAPWGHVTQVHEIEVMYPPSVETVPENGELEVNLGEKVDMQCVAKGVPAPIISWRTKDGEIPLLDVRPQLRFHADNRSLSGRYTCVAANGVGNTEAHIDLRIRYKPEVHVRKPWVHTYPGMRAKLDCTVISWPEAKVEWYFKNETLKYTSRIVPLDPRRYNHSNDYSLLIRNVEPSDYGSYLCRASNSLGITEKIIELTAIANPPVFKKESRVSSYMSYNFIWEVYSYSPIIEYQFWFRKYRRGAGGEWHKLYIPGASDAVSPVHIRSFNLTGLDAATYYEAVVMSRNRYGWSHPSEILRFHTEGTLDNLGEDSGRETGDSHEQNRIPVVQLESMSQPYPLANISRSTCNQATLLSLILSMLIIECLYYDTQQQI